MCFEQKLPTHLITLVEKLRTYTYPVKTQLLRDWFSVYIYKEEEEEEAAVFLMCSQEKNYCLSYQQSQQQKNYELTYKSIKTPILGDCMIGKRFSLHLIIEKLTVCLSLH